MLITFMYIALGLAFGFIIVFFAAKYIRNKKLRAVRDMQRTNPEFGALEDEKRNILAERANLENDHPYQKLLNAKFRLESAKKTGDTTLEKRIEDYIESILIQYKTDCEHLEKAFHAQIEAMSNRLTEIDLKQKHMEIISRKNAFKPGKLFKE